MITYFLITYIFDNDNHPEERVIRFIQWKLYIYIREKEISCMHYYRLEINEKISIIRSNQ